MAQRRRHIYHVNVVNPQGAESLWTMSRESGSHFQWKVTMASLNGWQLSVDIARHLVSQPRPDMSQSNLLMSCLSSPPLLSLLFGVCVSLCVHAFKYQIHINFDIEAEIYLIAFLPQNVALPHTHTLIYTLSSTFYILLTLGWFDHRNCRFASDCLNVSRSRRPDDFCHQRSAQWLLGIRKYFGFPTDFPVFSFCHFIKKPSL